MADGKAQRQQPLLIEMVRRDCSPLWFSTNVSPACKKYDLEAGNRVGDSTVYCEKKKKKHVTKFVF